MHTQEGQSPLPTNSINIHHDGRVLPSQPRSRSPRLFYWAQGPETGTRGRSQQWIFLDTRSGCGSLGISRWGRPEQYLRQTPWAPYLPQVEGLHVSLDAHN